MDYILPINVLNITSSLFIVKIKYVIINSTKRYYNNKFRLQYRKLYKYFSQKKKKKIIRNKENKGW